MALGATQGALLPSDSYEGKVLNVGIGAGAGAAGQLVGNTIGKGLNTVQASQLAKKKLRPLRRVEHCRLFLIETSKYCLTQMALMLAVWLVKHSAAYKT